MELNKTNPEIHKLKNIAIADNFVIGDNFNFNNEKLTIKEIKRAGDKETLTLIDDTKKTIVISKEEAYIIIENNKGVAKEISYTQFEKIINNLNTKKIKVKTLQSENIARKKILQEKSSGIEIKTLQDVENIKPRDFFVRDNTKFIIDKVEKFSKHEKITVVLIHSPKQSFEFNKKKYIREISKSQLTDILKYAKQKKFKKCY